jgi:hypothetical protein
MMNNRRNLSTTTMVHINRWHLTLIALVVLSIMHFLIDYFCIQPINKKTMNINLQQQQHYPAESRDTIQYQYNKWKNNQEQIHLLQHLREQGISTVDLPITSNSTIILTTNNDVNCSTTTKNIPFVVPNHFGNNIMYNKTYSGTKDTVLLVTKYWNEKLCNNKDDSTLRARSFHPSSKNEYNTMINVSFSCQKLYDHGSYGSGNFMMAFYTLRLFAQQIGNIDVSITCSDAIDTKSSLILPWIMGSFPRTYWIENENKNSKTTWISLMLRKSCISDGPSVSQLCRRYSFSNYLIYMYKDIIFELRRMAIALVGVPSINHPAKKWSEENLWSRNNDSVIQFKNSRMQVPTPQETDLPLYQNVEIDDVALHFRCGDIMNVPHTGGFGFMKFHSYIKNLPTDKQFRSIGIITQPFPGSSNSTQIRPNDSRHSTDRCPRVVYAFQQYLQDQNFTYTTIEENGNTLTKDVVITIRNDPNETISLAVTRMIMAPVHLVVGATSFGSLAALASFSQQSFIQAGRAHSGWLTSPVNVNRLVPSIRTMEEPMMYSNKCFKLWNKDNGTSVIKWMSS